MYFGPLLSVKNSVEQNFVREVAPRIAQPLGRRSFKDIRVELERGA